MKPPPPPPAPSGEPANGYGEIMIQIWPKKDWESAEVAIRKPPELPFPFMMVACEHLIRATAQASGLGYEKAIDLLVDGALKSKGKIQ